LLLCSDGRTAHSRRMAVPINNKWLTIKKPRVNAAFLSVSLSWRYRLILTGPVKIRLFSVVG
jgi:hypothetical protein